MAKNRMEEVAKLLGLELEEEFEIGKFERYKFTVNGLMFWSKNHQTWVHLDRIEQLLLGRNEIVKLSKPILDKEEKEYLSAVIRPFRNRIRCIIKSKDLPDEYLRIHLERYDDKKDGDIIYLPRFEVDTMYKGMQVNKKYTLEELEL